MKLKYKKIEHNLSQVAIDLYDKLEHIDDRYTRNIYSQIISNTIADGFDIITNFDLGEDVNYYNIFKYNIFFVVYMLFVEKYSIDIDAYYKIFKLDEREYSKFKRFLNHGDDYHRFIIKFSKYVSKSLGITNDIINIGLMNNLFYNSYNTLLINKYKLAI